MGSNLLATGSHDDCIAQLTRSEWDLLCWLRGLEQLCLHSLLGERSLLRSRLFFVGFVLGQLYSVRSVREGKEAESGSSARKSCDGNMIQ